MSTHVTNVHCFCQQSRHYSLSHTTLFFRQWDSAIKWKEKQLSILTLRMLLGTSTAYQHTYFQFNIIHYQVLTACIYIDTQPNAGRTTILPLSRAITQFH